MLYKHQSEALRRTEGKNRVAFYHDMGLGKTFTGAAKMCELNADTNLIVCQKSKIKDWVDHLRNVVSLPCVYDLSNTKEFKAFNLDVGKYVVFGVINYDILFRRKELKCLTHFTLMLDESSLIQNPTAKRTKFIMAMQPDNVILLSGTPTGGKYERLITQMHLLGWNINEVAFWNQYVDWEWQELDGFYQRKIVGYKNEERLKRKMREHGCDFLKTDEVFDFPEQIDQTISIPTTKEYKSFKKGSYLELKDGTQLIGDCTLNQMLYERQLCGQYNLDKVNALRDLLESSEDRFIIFYNFNAELDILKGISDALERPYSVVNGKDKDLTAYEDKSDSITFIQYQAGAMGLNLQKANKIIYFTPPLSSELFEQSKKRIHRIGQDKSCFYYYLTCKNSVEEHIYATLRMRKDYTEKLFEGGD